MFFTRSDTCVEFSLTKDRSIKQIETRFKPVKQT